MKMIMAIINESRLDPVIEGLLEKEITGITVSDVRGIGQVDLTEGGEYVDFHRKVRLEIVVSNDRFKRLAIETIMERAGEVKKPGAGKIFVYPVEEVYRVRNGDRDETALQSGKE